MKNIKILSTKGDLDTTIHEAEGDKLAILCPGFLDSKDYTGLLELSNRLNEKGYTVVRFDPTGTWNSAGDISDYTMTQYLKDIGNVLEYMLKEKDYKNILIGGHSQGGQLAILYAARDPRINFVLAIMPSAGPTEGERREKWEKYGHTSKRDLPFDQEKIIEFKVPFNHVLDRDQYNAFEDIKKIKVPILLIAGELDEIVPPEGVEKLFKNASQPKTFLSLPNIGHGYRLNDEEVKFVNEKILERL
jgi:pimeloyl-ACP methyl ester carboxylesterase